MSHSRKPSTDDALANNPAPTTSMLSYLIGSLFGFVSSVLTKRPYMPSKWFNWSMFGASNCARTYKLSSNPSAFFACRQLDHKNIILNSDNAEQPNVSMKN